MKHTHSGRAHALRSTSASADRRQWQHAHDAAPEHPRGAAQRQLITQLFGPAATAPVQRKPGKDTLDELANPAWQPPGRTETGAGKRAITGADLRKLMEGAAQAAWQTYAFHATKTANVDSILQDGLDPGRGGTGAAAANAEFQEHSRAQVHYTRVRPAAEAYRDHFEGHGAFAFKDPAPGPAEVLKLALPRTVVDHEEVDPDSPARDRAVRTAVTVPPRHIRRTLAQPLPAPRAANRRGGEPAPLEPGANAGAWKAHVLRCVGETGALLSHMPSTATNVLYEMMRAGMDVTTILQMVKQGLQSMSASDVLGLSPEAARLNPRVFQNMDATGDSFEAQ